MRKIRIGFSEPSKRKPGSELIKWWTDAPYSHTYIRFDSERLGISNVYHAAHGMVHFREFENFKYENSVVEEYEFEITDAQYDAFLVHCMRMSGEKYGYMDLASIVVSDIGYKLGLEIKTRNDRGYICSELLAVLLVTQMGVKFEKPLNLVVPKDINLKVREMVKAA